HTRFSRDWSSDVCSSDLSALARSAARLAYSGAMHARTTTFLTELAHRAIPTSLSAEGDVREGMPIPDLPFVQLHEPLDERRLAEIGRAACRARGSRSGRG